MEGGFIMNEVDDKTLRNVRGGFNAWVALGIAAAIVYISGFFEGITNPNHCGS